MRVAFTFIGGTKWTGGRNYLLNLFMVLARYQSGRITPVMFAGTDCDAAELASFSIIPGTEVIQTPLMNESRRHTELARGILFGRDAELLGLFRGAKIDAVFEPARYFGWRLGIPVIAWFPDFQHRALPGLFSRRAWWKREIGVRTQIMTGRTVMLSSETARSECHRYYPHSGGRTRIVRFAIPSCDPISPVDARAVADSYALPERFFFLPNQFWQHKNHQLVLDALVILRSRGLKVVVAASGNQHDPLVPGHFAAFKRRLDASPVSDAFRLLGMIPHAHIAPLMRAGVALVNPSLCEGWSTTVEEARATGTPMLLSNLAVHREQMGEQARYFDPLSAESLAEALSTFTPLSAEDREQRAVDARADAHRRVAQFAADFIDLCELAANSRTTARNASA
jgi:glycosyltransferase involved in cell wall biosynthesis